MTQVNCLSPEDVLRVHEALCDDFAETHDPIFPPGVKSQALLESAVGRQHAGWDGFRKYRDAISNAATLTFGLCNDHPFHNGNKRTALVSMLAHLDRNHQTLVDTRQEELFEMILALADNRMAAFANPHGVKHHILRRSPADAEVEALAGWLRPRAHRVKRGERQITYRELRAILKRHNYDLGAARSNQVEVVRVAERRRLFREPVLERKRIGAIGYRNEGETVSLKTIKEVRRLAQLREEDGCDSESFYGSGDHFDVFINRYRTILRRLARR